MTMAAASLASMSRSIWSWAAHHSGEFLGSVANFSVSFEEDKNLGLRCSFRSTHARVGVASQAVPGVCASGQLNATICGHASRKRANATTKGTKLLIIGLIWSDEEEGG